MEKPDKKDIERPMGGLSLMMIMTTIWTVISLFFMNSNTPRLIGLLFLVIVLFFAYNYIQLSKLKDKLGAGKEATAEEKKQNRWFIIIFAAEGIAIFLAKNILVNIHHDELFISSMALIVGLHFFPLAMIYRRSFYYWVAVWTSIIAVTGVASISQGTLTEQMANSLLGIGFAISTSLLGMKMVYDSRKLSS